MLTESNSNFSVFSVVISFFEKGHKHNVVCVSSFSSGMFFVDVNAALSFAF